MTHKLPPNLLALFAARPALRYLPPSDHAPEERKTNNIGGVAQYLGAIKEYEDISYEPTESWLQRKDRLKLERKEKQENLQTEGMSIHFLFTVCRHTLCTIANDYIAKQTTRRMTPKSGVMLSRPFSLPG